MFENAIEKISGFTRPIHFITRKYQSREITPGTATLFFVNDDGVAITCKHVLNDILAANEINRKYREFAGKRDTLPSGSQRNAVLKQLNRDYNYDINSTVEMRNCFINCIECAPEKFDFQFKAHDKYDIAFIRFLYIDKILYNGHAVFPKNCDSLKRGKFLCRLGFPFPEFSNFQYDSMKDEISWTKEGRDNTPSFPIEGMLTRFVNDDNGVTCGIELSTPGLRGQSGGPLFDVNGIVYGIQSQTASYHLGFDQVRHEILYEGIKKKIDDYPFLHVGRCVHMDIIKEFLRENDIKFYEE